MGVHDKDTILINVMAMTDAQMRQQSSFAGFDFDREWDIFAGINDGYPYLRSPRWIVPSPAEQPSAWAKTDVSRSLFVFF